ncbi:response regulator [Labilibaculum sp. DW002]|uniref:histidine kinase n=1 Tax=Paralabilibaculum antarcticum TaxID=2912572 RepID=A0ABT5VUQ0_9BACT|nr:response regulator [Labilibaculum sp. DW002]MDE5419026.1 response regulator [Labilibaculum sp. DW002]
MRKILAIDDNKDNLVVYQAILKRYYSTCTIITCQSGSEGIEMAITEQPDTILLDIIMPGMDGFETCQRLKKEIKTKHIPIILITAMRGDKKSRIKGLEIGADAFLSKPIEEEELIAQLNVMLRIKDAEDELRKENKILGIGIENKIKELEETNRKMETLLNNLPGFVYTCANDRDWKMEYISKGCTNISGYTPEDFIKNSKINFNQIILPEYRDLLWNKWQEALGRRGVFEEEYPIRNKNGKIHWVWERGCGIFDGNRLVSLEGFITDITQRKKLTEELILAKEDAEKSDKIKSTFLASMSHELRTPLNAVIGFSELIHKDSNIEDILNFNAIINKSGNNLLALIEDLFDISLIETGDINIEHERFSIEETLDEVHSIITSEQTNLGKEELQLKRNIKLQNTDLILNSDQNRIKQVLLNLLKNALKFTKSGTVEFGCEEIIQNQIPMIKFHVTDSGIGIPLDKQELIFEVFRQVDESKTRIYGGTGLGLTICKRLINLLGGEIWVNSEEGKGASFYFTIPINMDNAKQNSTDEFTQQHLNLKGKTILIAEDDTASYSYLLELLRKEGVDCIRAKNGKEAVGYCTTNKEVDLVLMDINMPIMNGYEATEQIKKINPKLPIIAQTAYAMAGDQEKILSAGCDLYLSKPIGKQKLLEAINKCLNKSRKLTSIQE